jgi:alkanesulfonate monooxygenase SsuD/methylene tetrahydromethanopterin reductase-like flavin-dependent oxidoreductase (luciferase family)
MYSSDCWAVLGALAATTTRLRLGSLVSCVLYRNPALVARMAADVDRISGGRFVLGLGAGDDRTEFEKLGIEFPPTVQRQEALEEALHIISALLREGRCSYSGRYFRASEAELQPGPVQRPYVPILIGGGGERTTLRQVAQYADASNFGAHEYTGRAWKLADAKRKFARLNEHCLAFGRPYEAIVRSHWCFRVIVGQNQTAVSEKLERLPSDLRRQFSRSLLAGTPTSLVRQFRELIRAGFRYFIANTGLDDESVLLLAKQVVPELQTPPRT